MSVMANTYHLWSVYYTLGKHFINVIILKFYNSIKCFLALCLQLVKMKEIRGSK